MENDCYIDAAIKIIALSLLIWAIGTSRTRDTMMRHDHLTLLDDFLDDFLDLDLVLDVLSWSPSEKSLRRMAPSRTGATGEVGAPI